MEALLVREPLLLDHEGASVGVAQDDGHERRQDLDEVDDPGNRLLFPSDLGKLSQYLGFSSRGKHGTEIVKTRHHHPWHDSFQDGGCPKSTQQQGSSTNKCHGQDQCWGLQSRRRPRKNQVQEGRNRASPARLVKLNKSLDRTQRDLIENEYFMGGILKIEATTMHADLSRWVLQMYNPESECIEVPGRGEIPVTADSVHQTLGLRNSGEEVFYRGMQKPYRS
ncbi:hypothetical protein ZWY2020_051160 [Hordeum vulgare]|nr:hypothetical protein ZWY2020_051160 [Hordeum vulgare]